LVALCEEAGLEPGDRVFLDSAKDYALDLSDNAVGAAWNQAVQRVIAEGVDIAANHHLRKDGNGGKGSGKPRTLAEMYGSTWIGAGAGTVVLLWPEEPGSPVVELSTLKSAAEDVGPLNLMHDIDAGTFTVIDRVDVSHVLYARRHTTASLRDLALATGGKDDRAGLEKVRRRVKRLVAAGHVTEHLHPTTAGGTPATFYQWTGGIPGV
jgi:hypothetical protein